MQLIDIDLTAAHDEVTWKPARDDARRGQPGVTAPRRRQATFFGLAPRWLLWLSSGAL